MPFGGLLSAGISAGRSILGGLFGKGASGDYIKYLKQAQDFLKQQEDQGLQNYSPYLNTGKNATYQLGSLLGTPGQGLLTPWNQKFTAPTEAEAEQTPGFQFQLHQGLDALQNSAAGKGSLLTGRTLADLNNYAQGTASTNYQNTFNNALTQYQTAYQSFLNNQNSTYSRLMGLSGEGLSAAGGAGQLISGIGGDVASLYGQEGAAAAGGTLALGQGIGGGLSSIGSGLMLSHLLGGSSTNGGGGGPTDFSANPGQYDPVSGTYV
jgi:hypothetical protein